MPTSDACIWRNEEENKSELCKLKIIIQRKKKQETTYQDAGFYIIKRMAVITFTHLSSEKIAIDRGTDVIVVVGSLFSVNHKC